MQNNIIASAPSRFSHNSGTINLLKDVSSAQKLPGYDAMLQNLLRQTLDFYAHGRSKQSTYKKLGLRPSSGILIQGASGTGKTALAYLLGKESSAHFKFLAISCAELVHKVIGETERKLTEIFTAGTCYMIAVLMVVITVLPHLNSTTAGPMLSAT